MIDEQTKVATVVVNEERFDQYRDKATQEIGDQKCIIPHTPYLNITITCMFIYPLSFQSNLNLCTPPSMSSGLWRLAAREAHLPTLPLASALRGGAAVDAARALGARRRASRGVHRLRG